MGVLVDERADTLDVTATIIDLANRGYFHITEKPKQWLFGSTDYVLHRKKKNDEKLIPYETLFLDKLFESGDTVAISSLKYKFYKDLAKVKEALYTDLTKKGYFDKNPESVRSGYIALGISGVVVGILLFSWVYPIFEASIVMGFVAGVGYLE